MATCNFQTHVDGVTSLTLTRHNEFGGYSVFHISTLDSVSIDIFLPFDAVIPGVTTKEPAGKE